MLGLIAFVGFVVVRFSATYLAGDPFEQRYAQLMVATLAAVSLVVVANHLVLLGIAWATASLALHGLLTFFGDRPVAVAVAHKKFLLARCADACMIGAVIAIWTTFDTLRIDEIVAGAVEAPTLPAGARIAIVLVAIAALLKCAQLPFHGWLIQVMEAPTPVSALLHAGVVNLGGFVLLRFAPVVDRSVETRTLLVVAGVCTAVVASLVMTTRVSVKVSLAWSTCAQMGFMLMQCGIGLWEMALLHLVAHSLYKAHAFLAAGGAVRRTQRRQLAPRPTTPSVAALAVGTVTAVLGTAVVSIAWEALPGTSPLSPAIWVLLGIVALALVPLVMPNEHGLRALSIVRALAVPAAYLALHEVFAELVPSGPDAPTALLAFVAVAAVTLFVIQSASLLRPDGAVVSRLRPWIYAGLFLDDAFTRLAFAVSPPPAAHTRPTPLPQPKAVPTVRTVARLPEEPALAFSTLTPETDAP
jgi:NAD(P)H-quinone oxidoreductase subunit 5